jgi:uncharacterized protein (DUF2267 family)
MTAVLEHCVQSTQIWLNDIMHHLGWNDPERALRALRVVLHALRDRLGVDEVAHLGAQLPQLVRGVYYEGWHPAGKPFRMHREEFLDTIQSGLCNDPVLESLDVARAVLKTLSQHISPGEFKKILGCLPNDLRDLWL